MKEITETDLIIGAKYNIPNRFSNPYIYFGSTKTIGSLYRSHLVFINNLHNVIDFDLDDIKGITQIHERVEKSMDLWIVYNNKSPSPDHWLDILTNLNTDGDLYFSEEEAIGVPNGDEEIKKINVTVKY